ncbi:MAG TPA: Mrp/NBP35 family ATP-binding protein [Gemmatimonadaceae bacterium]|nr:Mrp/NBP35 family ATP-binding protein [Gemmatimonadaceae bacterium]
MTLRGRIVEALGGVTNPRTGHTLIEGAMIRDLALTDDGKVRLTFLLGAQDPASLVRDVRQAIERVDGVTEVRVDVKDPSQAQRSAAQASAPPPNPRALPVMEPPRAAPGPQRPAPPAPVTYPNLGRIIAISSGKGGVGKSTVATNVAVSLARSGARVGLMDADIYGPNVPRMMGIDEPPPVENERIIPLEAHGVKLMSIGFMVARDAPAIWRGPIIMKVITQFLRDVVWGKLDYFLVDMPPGTGDAQLSLVQATQVHGAVIVTTPQEVAIGDALRGAKMFERVGVPVLGIVENMSYFACPHCGKPSPLFGSGGGARLAAEVGVPLLGEIPLYQQVLEGGDAGRPIVVAEAESAAARALAATAAKIRQRIDGQGAAAGT